MNGRHGFVRKLGVALIVAGISFGGAVLADNVLPTISISASVVSKKALSTSSSGVPTEEVTVTRRVSYADLDLKKHSDVQTLKRRIEEAAKLACEQIDTLYPLERPESPSCIRQSVAKADREVAAAITAAQGNAGE